MTSKRSDDFEELLHKSDSKIAGFDHYQRSSIQKIQHYLHGNPAMVPVIILFMSVISFGFISGDKFFSTFNLSLIMQQVAIVGILASAQTLIILTAGIDLSVAAIMVLSYVVMGNLAVHEGVPAPLAVAIGMMVAVAAGTVNGFLVTKVKLPPFIVTLGTWQIFLAIVYLYTGSQSIRGQDIDAAAPLLKFFGQRINVGGAVFTYGVFLMIAVFIIVWYLLNRTAWGRHVYAVGDDKEAADLSGIRSDRLLLTVYALAGLICGIAAWAAIGRVGSVSPSSFVDANLGSITAVVIGGTSLFGGRGAIFGSLFGALIVGVFSSGLKLAGADPQWEMFAIGCLIIAAVALDQWIRRVSA